MKALLCLFCLAAARTSSWDALIKTPRQTWINLGLAALIVMVSVRTWRTLRRVNQFAPYIALTIMGAMVFCYWVYERSEPRFLTPLVDVAAEVLPTKSRQSEDLEKFRKGRDAEKLIGR